MSSCCRDLDQKGLASRHGVEVSTWDGQLELMSRHHYEVATWVAAKEVATWKGTSRPG